MSARTAKATRTTGADVRIGRVRITAEGATHGRLQADGDRLASEIGAAVSRQLGRGRVRIGELSVRVGVDQLGDEAVRERIASGIARRILNSLQD